jgi:hypothetical protein
MNIASIFADLCKMQQRQVNLSNRLGRLGEPSIADAGQVVTCMEMYTQDATDTFK